MDYATFSTELLKALEWPKTLFATTHEELLVEVKRLKAIERDGKALNNACDRVADMVENLAKLPRIDEITVTDVDGIASRDGVVARVSLNDLDDESLIKKAYTLCLDTEMGNTLHEVILLEEIYKKSGRLTNLLRRRLRGIIQQCKARTDKD